ncbi:MAG: M6 family metalloprotease domain-containing protein, partial [candidate division Zixibacteria bacterium]|nr:M6 family metalloprotease domain-containing protein [candidate division Zixibacteria bacterium]
VDLADADVDFSQFDNNGDGTVDGLFVIHAGTGYEESGNDCEIHSHQWSITSRYHDGVRISPYSIEPEETASQQRLSAIGVFCHEFGHVLGLPDMYDTDYSSAGVGYWELMGSGSYNGTSQTPSHLSAWSKARLGWMSLTNVTSNLTDVSLPALAWNPVAYRVWKHGLSGNQYWIVENRQRMGFDAELPGSGVLIWHIDDNVGGNTNEWHPKVFLEQADGKFHLQNDNNSGDAGDPYPNFGYAPEFTDKTTPGSKDYSSVSTEVAVWNITPSDSVMTADLDVYWSRPYFTMTDYSFSDAVGGDGDGVLEPGETIRLTFSLSNDWKDAVDASATLTIDDASIPITHGTSSMGTIASGGSGDNDVDPLIFEVPAGYAGRIDSFFITISSNGGGNTNLLTLERNVGVPHVLLVDDDNGDTLQSFYSNPMYVLRMPSDRWDKSVSGNPDSSLLGKYEAVFWFTGDNRTNPLAIADVTAMKGYLDNGGKLFLTGQGIAKQLSTLDSAFLADYLKAQYISTSLIPVLAAEAGPIFTGLPYIVINGHGGANNQSAPDHITVLSGAAPEAYYLSTTRRAALSYSGAYQLVFFGFGFESIIAGDADRADRDSVFNRIMDFFGMSGMSGYPSVSAVAVGPGGQMNLVSHTPEISWGYHDAGEAPQQSYKVQVGTDNEWSVAELWDIGPISGTDTMATYAGGVLEDGHTYYVRVQVYNGLQWSPWKVSQFRMNTAPSTPTNLSPDNMTAVATATPVLQLSNTNDNDGDVLTYAFQVCSDSQMTVVVAETSGYPHGTGTTTWTVTPSLNDDQEYFWRVRANDGYEDGLWTQGASFWVNSVNQSPVAFDLIAPVNDSVTMDPKPTFIWHASGDGDLHDAVHYRVLWADNAEFTDADSSDAIFDTTYTMPESLLLGNVYSWKVNAYDLFGGVTPSQNVNQLKMWLFGDANSDGKVNVGDAVFIITYVFRGGPAPNPLAVGDVNGDCKINVGDAVYLITYLFRSGTPPVQGCI